MYLRNVTSVEFYRNTQRYISDDRNLQFLISFHLELCSYPLCSGLFLIHCPGKWSFQELMLYLSHVLQYKKIISKSYLLLSNPNVFIFNLNLMPL
jgi:hypothetical protein